MPPQSPMPPLTASDPWVILRQYGTALQLESNLQGPQAYARIRTLLLQAADQLLVEILQEELQGHRRIEVPALTLVSGGR